MSDCICNLNSPLPDIEITFDSDIYNIQYLHNKMFLPKCMHNLKLPYWSKSCNENHFKSMSTVCKIPHISIGQRL